MTEIFNNPVDDGYKTLREQIVTGRLQPNERLVELDLSERLGVGRAAIRTALVRLEADGLVERVRHRGAKVRFVDLREAVEILEARAVVEGLSAHHAALKATPEGIVKLRAILTGLRRKLEADDLLGASEENAVLHRMISELGEHRTAQRLSMALNSQLVRFQYRTILRPGRAKRSYAEHKVIVDAIAARNPAAAERAMRRHLSNVVRALSDS